ncbi:MAG: DUF4145 domain-containing protein [Acidobacteriia bacterium]|nr:DUF4145 domain-containing protein [Terriglobia bacterium]
MADLITLIPWAILRLLRHECLAEMDEKGEPLTLELDPQLNHPSLQTMEKDLKDVLSPEHAYLLFALKDRHTEEDVRMAVDELFLGSWGDRIAEECVNAEWPELLSRVYQGLVDFAEELGDSLARKREGVGSRYAANLDTLTEKARPGANFNSTERKYARDMVSLFPRIVRRATPLKILATTDRAPKQLLAYLTEASRCYIYGHFIACVVLCRATIEGAFEDFLTKQGRGRDVSQIESDKLFKLINLARNAGLITVGIFDDAHDIRTLANETLHNEQLPQEHDCMVAFERTRNIVEYLYSRSTQAEGRVQGDA